MMLGASTGLCANWTNASKQGDQGSWKLRRKLSKHIRFESCITHYYKSVQNNNLRGHVNSNVGYAVHTTYLATGIYTPGLTPMR